MVTPYFIFLKKCLDWMTSLDIFWHTALRTERDKLRPQRGSDWPGLLSKPAADPEIGLGSDTQFIHLLYTLVEGPL